MLTLQNKRILAQLFVKIIKAIRFTEHDKVDASKKIKKFERSNMGCQSQLIWTSYICCLFIFVWICLNKKHTLNAGIRKPKIPKICSTTYGWIFGQNEGEKEGIRQIL